MYTHSHFAVLVSGQVERGSQCIAGIWSENYSFVNKVNDHCCILIEFCMATYVSAVACIAVY